MRITGQTLNQLKPLLTKALEEGAEVSFQYHGKQRNGPLTDFGWGPQGPFITIEHKKYALGYQDGGYQTEIKSFSLAKMSELHVDQFVTT
jgi:hypothetical protein